MGSGVNHWFLSGAGEITLERGAPKTREADLSRSTSHQSDQIFDKTKRLGRMQMPVSFEL